MDVFDAMVTQLETIVYLLRIIAISVILLLAGKFLKFVVEAF